MEQRDLDFEIDVTPDQWAELGRTADALGPESGGLAWHEERFEEIHLLLRDVDAPNLWRDWVSAEETYGPPRRVVARFRFNDGRPYADIDIPDFAEQPVVSEDEEEAMRIELEKWIREKWHALLRDSGLHFERGHLPQG